MPDVIIMPWVTDGAPPVFTENNRTSMKEASQVLADYLATQNSTLETLYRANTSLPLPSLAPRLSKFIGLTQIKDEFSLNRKEKALLIQPYLCAIQDKFVVFSQLSSREKWTTVAIGSQILSLTQKNPSQKYNLSQALVAATKNSWMTLETRAPYDHNLKVSLHNEESGAPGRDPSCLNLILAKSILDYAQVNSELNSESYGYLRQSGADLTLIPARSTRKFLIQYKANQEAKKEMLKTSIKVIESVFGRRHPISLEMDLKLEESNQELKFLGTEKMIAFLRSEANLLSLNSQPEVLKKDRAWLYIDKGRAWGLKIGDRLETEGGAIKGHIVAYYGPEMNLKSKDGTPITEGAIVYVRKGQELTNKGQLFDWDKTTYPTSYPMKKEK
jgi:hypothetical protein